MIKAKGFTLVETIVSLFVLSIALTGILAIITFNLNIANNIKNSFIASGLAQEGIEVTRNLRDTDWFAQNEFGAFGSSLGPMSNGIYCVQWDSVQLIDPCSDTKLYKDNNGIYSHDASGQSTPFSRTVTIEKVNASEIKVQVTVSWDERKNNKEINVEEHLFNWF